MSLRTTIKRNMTEKQTQEFIKCISEADVRESDVSWEAAKANCPKTHNYKNVHEIESILIDKHQFLLTLLEQMVKLTVKIEKPIKPTNGVQRVSLGTGFIQRVRKITKKRKSENGSSGVKELSKFGFLTISTVHHVLYPKLKQDEKTDFKEASIWIDYDFDNSKYKVAKTFTIVESDKDINTYDWCSFECTTEDIDLIDRLAGFISKLEDEQLKVYSYYNELKQKEKPDANKQKKESELQKGKGHHDAKSDTDLIVLIGHPHGGPKQVSVGKQKRPKEILKQVRDQQEWCCYYHDAETCSGSSGSPVFIFGQPLCGYGYWFGHAHNHSGKFSDNLKVTSIGVDHIVIIKDKFK